MMTAYIVVVTKQLNNLNLFAGRSIKSWLKKKVIKIKQNNLKTIIKIRICSLRKER